MSPSRNMRIRAILFDFAGTLVDGHLEIDRCREAAVSLINQAGYSISKDQYVTALKPGLEVAKQKKLQVPPVETAFSEVIKDTLTRLGVQTSDSLIKAIEETDYTFYSWRLKPGVKELILDLHAKLLLGIVSDSWTDSILRVLADSGLLNYFKTVVLSKDVGYRKPDRRIYLRAIEDIGVPAEQILFVGDDYLDDVIGPSSLGMAQFWVGEGSNYCLQDLPAALSRRMYSYGRE